MLIRDLTPEDIPVLKAIWETQGLAKCFPDLTARDFPITKIAQEGEDILCAASGRQTVEAYIFVNRRLGSPHRRWNAVQILEHALAKDFNQRGVFEGHVYIDPQFASFGKRLMSIGWVREPWPCYCKEWPRG